MTGVLLKNIYSQRRVTRLCWSFIATAFICFWTYFLYCYTNENSNKIPAGKYTPIPFTQQQSVISSDTLSATAFTNIQQHQQGHSSKEIESLLIEMGHTLSQYQDQKNIKPEVDVTVLLQATEDTILRQIQATLSQTIQPKHICILFSQNSILNIIEPVIRASPIPITLVESATIYKREFYYVRDASWLTQQSSYITTEFTWVLEPKVIPENDYLYYTYGLLNTSDYKSTLVGYQTGILHSNSNQLECLHSNAIERVRKVDMIHGSWFLRTSWVRLLRQELNHRVLDLPLGYFISSSLLYRANISSIAIPSKLKPVTSPSFCSDWVQTLHVSSFHSVLPSVVDEQKLEQNKGRLALLLNGEEHAQELFPLLCKLMSQQDIQVHVILTNGFTRYRFQEMISQCIHRNTFMIHDLTTAYNNGVDKDLDANNFDFVSPLTRLLEHIEAHVLIQVKNNEDSYFYRAMQTVAHVQGVTTINLPPGQVDHSLWISDLSIEALKHWNTIKMELVIITDSRPKSLTRLLASTNNAFYLGDDTVELVIHLEQSSDNMTRALVQGFQWDHGKKKVRHRIRKGGLMPAIVESWFPSDNDNYGVLLEDDIELSPLFYSWSKYNILKYRYSPKEIEAHQHIYGVSLYSPRNLELLPEGRRPFNPEIVLENSGYSKRSPYATPIPCSWGAVYFPEHWREFHGYLTERIAKEEWKGYHNITVPSSRSERWKKSWKKYFIELVYLRAYVMVYPNFEEFQSFSTNHLEYGTHVKDNGRTQSKVMEFLVPLMQRDLILEQLPGHSLPAFRHLPIMDLWGRISTMQALDQIGSVWHPQVSVCQRTTGSFDPSDMLCPFEENVEKSMQIQIVK